MSHIQDSSASQCSLQISSILLQVYIKGERIMEKKILYTLIHLAYGEIGSHYLLLLLYSDKRIQLAYNVLLC